VVTGCVGTGVTGVVEMDERYSGWATRAMIRTSTKPPRRVNRSPFSTYSNGRENKKT
jgi:hypothetical protein